jgi:hypothetical protein
MNAFPIARSLTPGITPDLYPHICQINVYPGVMGRLIGGKTVESDGFLLKKRK